MTSFLKSENQLARQVKSVFSLVLALALILPTTMGVFAQNEEKVNVCHLTSSEENPWVVQSVNANQLQSHLDNGDFLYNGPVDDDGKPLKDVDGIWCAENVPDPAPEPALLTIQKVIINDNEGTAEVDDFSFQINDNVALPFESDGENVIELTAGTYDVVETGAQGYEVTYQGCSDISLDAGDEATCVITNDDDTPEQPTDIDNSCLLPVSANESDKITFFGESSDGISPNLQQTLDTEYGNGTIAVIADETGYATWDVTPGTGSVTLDGEFIAKYADYEQALGYYVNGDISTFIPIFKTASHTSSSPVVLAAGDSIPTTVIDTTGVSTIGFALIPQDYDGAHITLATDASLNTPVEDHAAVYNHLSNTYVLAFEDLPFAHGNIDYDYQDTVVEINVLRCSEEEGGGDNETPSADLGITKTVNDSTATTSQTITYTVTVTNNGPDTANLVSVADTLPVGLNFVSASSTVGIYSTITNTWTIGTLLNGESATLEISVVVTATSGTITNTATVSLNPDIDANETNDSSNVDVFLNVESITSSDEPTDDNNGGGGGGGSPSGTRTSGGGGGGTVAGASTSDPEPEVLGAFTGLPDTGTGPVESASLMSTVLALLFALIALNTFSIRVLKIHKK